MNSANSDFLKRKELYQELSIRFGNMQRFPTRVIGMTSERNASDLQFERLYEHEGRMMLRFSQVYSGEVRARDVAYIFVDLHKREAGASHFGKYKGRGDFYSRL